MGMNKPTTDEARAIEAGKVIDALGGTAAVARLCKIKPPSVSDWKKDGIPDARRQFLKLLRPDVFGEAPKTKKARAA
jgi:hypothetical protein